MLRNPRETDMDPVILLRQQIRVYSNVQNIPLRLAHVTTYNIHHFYVILFVLHFKGILHIDIKHHFKCAWVSQNAYLNKQ